MVQQPAKLDLVPKQPKNIAPAPSRVKNQRRPLTALDVHRLRRAVWMAEYTLLDKPPAADLKAEKLRVQACELSSELLSTLAALQTRLTPNL